MAQIQDVIAYFNERAADCERLAGFYRACGATGSEDAEVLEKPTRQQAAHFRDLAKAAEALDKAARAVFIAKGRHHTQLAMCALGDLLGIETVRP